MVTGTSTQSVVAADPRRWIALAILLTAAFMDTVDVTVVNIAIPSLQRDLGASAADIQWIVGGYALTFAAGLITGGRLGDLYGRKRILMIGLAAFTATSLLCGIAPNPDVLLIGRLAQGAAAALMVPQVLSIVNVIFPDEERSKVFGIYGGVLGLGTVAGPIIGALLLEWDLFGLGWRPIFLINLPLGVAGLILGKAIIGESRAQHARRLDLPGVGLLTAALFMIMLPLTQGRELGWPAWSIACLVGAVPVLALFVAHQYRLDRTGGQPLVPPHLFGLRSFSGGLGVQLMFGLASGVFFLAWALYLQVALGWSPLKAGLAGLPMSLALMAGAGVSSQVLVPRFGRAVLQVGAVLAAVGALGYHLLVVHYAADLATWQAIVAIVPMGLGLGLIIAPLADLILADVPKTDSGAASGVLNTTTQLGQALGIGLCSVVFFGRLDHGTGLPAAFAHSLWYVAAAFVLAFALLFTVRNRRAPAPTAGTVAS